MKKLVKIIGGILIACMITSPTIIPKGQLKAELRVERTQIIDNSAEGIPNFLVSYNENGQVIIYAIINEQLKEIASPWHYNASDRKFVSIGNLKFRYTWKESDSDWSWGWEFPGHYMRIYKYDPQKQELIETSRAMRFTTEHYQDYPFNEPYAITNQEVMQIINNAYQCLHGCFYYTGLATGEEEGMHLAYFPNKKDFVTMLETYWSPEAVTHIMQTYSNDWKEVEEFIGQSKEVTTNLYISNDISFAQYLKVQRTLVKVEDYSNNLKKVYTTETDSNGKTTNKSYMLKFCNRGWVMHNDSIFN